MGALLSALIGAAFAADLPSQTVSSSILQIGIVQRATRVTLRPEGLFSAVDQRTGQAHPLTASQDYPLESAEDGSLMLGPYVFIGQVRLLPSGPEDSMRVDSKKYPGNLIIKPNPDATFAVVGEMGIEEYLYGVLSAEMSPEWPIEALKAQAVVARTFTLGNLGKFKASGFDLSSDVRSQVYADMERQAPRAISAVHDTAGQILSLDGELLKTFYHSCCGGHTSSFASVWGDGGRLPKPLRGVPDRWCRLSPHSEWTAYFASEDILRALQAHKLPFTRLKGIRVGKRDASGAARTFVLSVDKTKAEVRASDLRAWLGPMELKSAKVLRIVPRKKGFVFQGRGFGHGVGLCQWGAKAMAQSGWGYKKILGYYFPGARLLVRDE